jgi:hypothetical protein
MVEMQHLIVDRNERMRREKRPGITFKVTPHSDPFSLT